MISEKKFIELLNLYLDHEISAEEVRVLEAEILSNPARHTLYRQYCAMHKGCLELAHTFAPQSEIAPAQNGSSEAKVTRPREASPAHRDKFGWGAWMGGLGLAAACGALVFFVFSHKHRSGLGSDSTGAFAPAPALLAVPLATPLNIPAPSPVASASLFGAPVGEGQALLVGGGDSASGTKHAFVTTVGMLVPAPAAEYLHAYNLRATRGHSFSASRFPVTYTDGPIATQRGHLDWVPLVDLREVMENETMPPTFQVRPAVAPSARVYRRQERRFEGGRVEMTRFQFQR